MSVAVASALVLSLVFGWSEWINRNAQGADDQERAAYVNEITQNLRRWYVLEASTIESNANAYSEADLLAVIAPMKKYGIRAASSARLGLPCVDANSSSCVAYHVFAVWLPPQSLNDTSALNATTGQFTPDPQAVSAVVSGQTIQGELVSQTLHDLDAIAASLQQYFVTQSLADFSRDPEKNYFRPIDCANVQPSEIPCIDTYTAGAATTLISAAGIEARKFVNAWNGDVLVSNLQDARSTAQPYSMVLRTTTPWGSTLSMTALQPI